jgi:hypothetical protein
MGASWHSKIILEKGYTICSFVLMEKDAFGYLTPRRRCPRERAAFERPLPEPPAWTRQS